MCSSILAITKRFGATFFSVGWKDMQSLPILIPNTETLVYVYSNSKMVAGTWNSDKLKMFASNNEDFSSPHCLLALPCSWQCLSRHRSMPARSMSLRKVSHKAFVFSVFSRNHGKTKPPTWRSVSSEALQLL